MVTSSSELLSLNYLSSGILSPSPRVATVLRTMDPGIGLKSLPQLAQGPMYLHTHVCVCVCVCVEGSTKNQCTVLSPPSCHPPNAEAGLSLFCCLGTCWPVPSTSQLLYSSSQQIFLEGLLSARHCAKCKEGKQSHVKDKPNSNNHTNSFSKCFFLTS